MPKQLKVDGELERADVARGCYASSFAIIWDPSLHYEVPCRAVFRWTLRGRGGLNVQNQNTADCCLTAHPRKEGRAIRVNPVFPGIQKRDLLTSCYSDRTRNTLAVVGPQKLDASGRQRASG